MNLRQMAELGVFERDKWECHHRKCPNKGNWIKIEAKYKGKRRDLNFVAFCEQHRPLAREDRILVSVEDLKRAILKKKLIKASHIP